MVVYLTVKDPGKTVVVPAPTFFDRDIEALNNWLEPHANGITVLESVHDINAAPLSVKIPSLTVWQSILDVSAGERAYSIRGACSNAQVL